MTAWEVLAYIACALIMTTSWAGGYAVYRREWKLR